MTDPPIADASPRPRTRGLPYALVVYMIGAMNRFAMLGVWPVTIWNAAKTHAIPRASPGESRRNASAAVSPTTVSQLTGPSTPRADTTSTSSPSTDAVTTSGTSGRPRARPSGG
ncbi:hypothetical protein [Curtobacterium sp. Csp1]|uniref:hypothetical protein n=1 Tax=Curtobacterium sp. Csp1 TaxID=2495429 RepID=UPI0020C5F1D5|nr:hypothetical protein [Curtobacterium sp. Csp1]